VQWIFEGGTPATSTDTLVTVNYNSAGSYAVTLIAIGANGTDTIVTNNYIQVSEINLGASLPVSYDFESSNNSIEVINQQNDSVYWRRTQETAAASSA
jgi:PKD repeat protein